MSAAFVSSYVLGFAWFAALNIVASAVASALAAVALRAGVARRGGVLLAIRLLPALASALFVGVFFLPAHWRLEPADAQESFGLVLCALAALGSLLVLRSVSRILMVAHAEWRLRACRRLPAVDRALGVYEVPGLAGVSLAGVFRTRILVGAAVRRTLTSGELSVALAHERAHRRALDNLKRFSMFCAPDVFGALALSRRLEAEWRATAEWLADARAVGGDGSRAVDLASALVKVSRLAAAPSGFVSSPAWSTLHDPPLLQMRVQRLITGAPPAAARSRGLYWLVPAALAIAVLLGSAALVSPSVHYMTEALVRLLP